MLVAGYYGPYGTIEATRTEAKTLANILQEKIAFHLTLECHLSNGKYV